MDASSFFILGLISATVGSIWTLIVAFRIGPNWGLVMMFAGLIVGPVFLYKHWSKAWPSMLLMYASIAMAAVAVESIR